MGVLDLENIKFSNHPNPEKHYKNIVSSSLWNTLSLENKEIRAKQIDYLEEKVLAGKAIKIRVRPGFIKFFSKLTGVSDYKGGAWRGDTIYLGHSSDLFNPQIIQHEGIHVLQQQELGGFIPWLIEIAKESYQYKKGHKNMNGNYDLSTKIPTELEAYVNQLVPGYIENRDKYAFKKYSTPKGVKIGINKIADSNYKLDKEILKEKRFESENNGDKQELSDIIHDEQKLEEIRSKDMKDPDIRVFNYLDKIVEITRVIEVLKEKQKQLEQNPKKFQASHKLKEMINLCTNEIANEDVSYMMEDEFTDIELIKKTINELEKKCHEYRKTPTFIWLEDKGKKDKGEEEKGKDNDLHKRDSGISSNKKDKLTVEVPEIYPDLDEY